MNFGSFYCVPALETLVEIANTRSTMLSAFDRVKKELEEVKG